MNRWTGRKVALIGMGISNRALARFLVARGAEVAGFDSKSEGELGDVVAEMRALSVPMATGPAYLEAAAHGPYDAVFLTPGIDRMQPELQALRRSGAWVGTEMELLFRLCRAPIVGVTGSSGKTTTTSLIGHILRRGSKPVWVGGNIGRPLIEHVGEFDENGWVVVELSSFQLEFMTRSPYIAVFTNLSPNHLDVHADFEEYREAKGRLFAHQHPDGWAVYNADDDEVAALAAESPAELFPFSRHRSLERGACVVDDAFVVRGVDGREERIAPLSDLRIPGWHNVENALAAVAAAHLAGMEAEAIRAGLREFPGVPHRLEKVAVKDGVTYVNDSIATTPTRTVAALEAFRDPVVLIAGGYDKKLSFEPLSEALGRVRVRAVVVLGATAGAIRQSISRRLGAGAPPIHSVASLEEAVQRARDLAQPGDVVLLSPACASFDMFPNFQVRGDTFKTLVLNI